MKGVIKVTQLHIDNGRPNNPEACAIAMGVYSVFSRAIIPIISLAGLNGSGPSVWIKGEGYPIAPYDVDARNDFIRKFDSISDFDDDRGRVSPSDFVVEIPSKLVSYYHGPVLFDLMEVEDEVVEPVQAQVQV